MKKQKWFCEACGVAGEVGHKESADVITVVKAIKADHHKRSPGCPNPIENIRALENESMQEEKDINKILEDLKRDFGLTDEQVKDIMDRYIVMYTPGFMKRARRMDIIREELKKFDAEPAILRLLLFAHDEDLEQGHLDKVILRIINFRNNYY